MNTKLNWFEYYFGHCLQTGWREMWNNFKMWRDLLSNNYKDYALMWYDDPYEECLNCFWDSINTDECLPKEYLEYLQELVDRIDRGEEKLIPLDEDFFDRWEDLTDDVFDHKDS